MIAALVKSYWLHLAVLALIVVLSTRIGYYRSNAITYKDQRDKATNRAETSEAVTNNLITAMNLIRDISQATQNAKEQQAKKGEARIVYIRQALEDDVCSKQLVPAPAADSLREYANGLRPRSSSADKH